MADAVGNLSQQDVSDILDGGGVFSELTVGVTAVEGKVGASALQYRKYVIFQALDSGIYFGLDNTVTISNGMPIYKNQLLMVPFGEGTSLYFIANGAGKKVRIIEVR